MAVRDEEASIGLGLEGEHVRQDFESWNVPFALRTHRPAGNRHARELSAGGAKREVLYSPRLQRIIAEVAEARECEEEEVEEEVRVILEEMGHKMFLPAVRFIALLLRPFVRSALHGIYINRGGLDQLRGLLGRWPVVLLPSHRSYLDFILISYIMFEQNTKLPYIAAGQDFMKMNLVSGLLRRSGAFFMRRTFGADRLYKAVFSEYVKTVLCSRDAPLEFFVEGTRSRTAKTLHPKLGLLSMVVEPYLAGLLPDIMLVPVSISYQRTLEEMLFSKELLGVPKPPESTKGLMKALSIISEDYGSIYVDIGQPISLHDFCTAREVSRVPHTAYPKDKSVLLPRERQVVLELSHKVLRCIHQGMRVYPTAMLAALLLQYPEGIEKDELAKKMEWLKTQLLLRGSKVHWEDDTASNIDFALKILSNSLQISNGGDNIRPLPLKFECPPSPPDFNIITIAGSKVTAEVAGDIMDLAFSRLLLSHYRNQLLHLFLSDGLLAVAIYHCLPCTECEECGCVKSEV